MATLTDEQRRRIEENKRKALAIRAAKLAAANAALPSTTSRPSFAPNQVPQTNPLPVTVINSNAASKPQYNNQKVPFYNNKFSPTPTKNNLFSNQNSPNKPSELKSVIANLSLISRDRFTVEFPFTQEIVNLLKTVPGKLYG